MNTPQIDDGGPAFPHDHQELGYCHRIAQPGMTIRDWFASQCDISAYNPIDTIIAALGEDFTVRQLATYIAEIRYCEADAMIAASKRPTQP